MTRVAFPIANMNDPHGDDLTLVFASIDAGDDLTLVFFCKHPWPLKSGGLGGGAAPLSAGSSNSDSNSSMNNNDDNNDNNTNHHIMPKIERMLRITNRKDNSHSSQNAKSSRSLKVRSQEAKKARS